VTLGLPVIMKCPICGGVLEKITTDLPFKRGGHSIVILKDLTAESLETDFVIILFSACVSYRSMATLTILSPGI
jgi:YgiT-type zinc finger domain-containing protein